VLAEHLEKEDVKDFLCLRQYSHTVAKAWSADRWALVGEAGAFVDPLYSPGTDFIALANSFTCELIRADFAGEEIADKAAFLNVQYRGLVSGAINLFRQAAPVYGHRSAMTAKVYWDNFSYWSYTCQYSQQRLYRLPLAEFLPFGDVGRRFLELGNTMQIVFRRWAESDPEEPDGTFRPVPVFPSVSIDAHIRVAQPMTLPETRAYFDLRLAQAEEMAAEILLRIVQVLPADRAGALLDEVHFHSSGLRITPARIALESLPTLERRQKLSEIARDVERNLGPVRRHADAPRVRADLVLRLPSAAAAPEIVS
jgi:hypothetical protein